MTRMEIIKASPKFIEWVKQEKIEKKKRFEELFASIDPKITAKLKQMRENERRNNNEG